VTLATSVERAACIVLGTIAPPAERCLTTLLLTNTLHRYGAKSVELVLPYFAYSRHDKGGGGRSIAFPLIKRLFGVSGVARIVTIDLHAPQVALGDGPPIVSLDPSHLFATALAAFAPDTASFVAPDRGALRRCDAVRRATGNEKPLIEGQKHRDDTGVHTIFRGAPNTRCIIVDDILDTGWTLIEAVEQLRRMGAERFVVCVSHGLFTAHDWENLWAKGVERVYTLDTTGELDQPTDERITRLSCGALLAQGVGSLMGESAARTDSTPDFREILS